MKLFTIGFTKKPAQRFFGELVATAKRSGLRRVVDVRIKPGSQLAGFAKKNDLAYFLDAICGVGYVHMPVLAPTPELLADYRKKQIDWAGYEPRFDALMRERRIEEALAEEHAAPGRPFLQDGDCLLCSEHEPDQCHRRLVVEYLQRRWDGLEVVHLT